MNLEIETKQCHGSRSSQSHIILLIAPSWPHVVRAPVLRIRLTGRDIVHVAWIVLGAGTDHLAVKRELLPYLHYFLDSWCFWALPYIDQVIVRYFPEDQEYQELKNND